MVMLPKVSHFVYQGGENLGRRPRGEVNGVEAISSVISSALSRLAKRLPEK